MAWRTTLEVSCHGREALCLAWSLSSRAAIRLCFSASEKQCIAHLIYVTQQEARYLNRLFLISWLITYFQAGLIPFAFQYIYHKMQSKQSPSNLVCIHTDIILFYCIIINLNRIVIWVQPYIMCSTLNPKEDTKTDKASLHENGYNRFTDKQQIRNVDLKYVNKDM